MAETPHADQDPAAKATPLASSSSPGDHGPPSTPPPAAKETREASSSSTSILPDSNSKSEDPHLSPSSVAALIYKLIHRFEQGIENGGNFFFNGGLREFRDHLQLINIQTDKIMDIRKLLEGGDSDSLEILLGGGVNGLEQLQDELTVCKQLVEEADRYLVEWIEKDELDDEGRMLKDEWEEALIRRGRGEGF